MEIVTKYTDEFLTLRIYQNDHLVSNLASLDATSTSDEDVFLSELRLRVESETIVNKNGEFLIPWDLLYVTLENQGWNPLRDNDRELLTKNFIEFVELPPECSHKICLKNKGFLSSGNLIIVASFLDSNENEHDLDKREGPIVTISQKQYLLSKKAFDLFCEIAKQPVGDEFSVEKEMLWFGRVQGFAKEANAILRRQLKNEEIISVDKIKPKVFVIDEDTIEVSPDTGDPDNEQFLKRFNDYKQIKGVYPLDQGGARRKRVVASEEVKKILKKLKKKRRYSGYEKAQFLDDPSSLVEGFDLSDFSERVYAIGEHVFHAVPSMVKGGTAEDWGLGIKLKEDTGRENETDTEDIPDDDGYVDSIRFNNKGELENFKEAIEDAKLNGTCYAKHKGKYIKFDPDIIDDYLTRVEEFLEKKSQANDLKKLALLIFSNCDYIEYGFAYQREKFKQPDFASYVIPEMLSKRWTLKDFQEEGYGWLRWLYENREGAYKGCLLADDMGLGKTLQIIALMTHLKELSHLTPSLVITPLVLLETWEEDHLNTIPEITKYIYHGSQREISEEELKKYDVVLITYDTLITEHQFKIGKIDFRLIVSDESQRIKNPRTRISDAVKSLKGNFRIAVTGTPIENSIAELWSIYDFATPGLLKSLREFMTEFGPNSKKTDSGADALKDVIKPVFLRRTKDTVLKELPPIKVINQRVSLTDLQRNLYSELISKYKSSENKSILAILTHLLMLLGHPLLIYNQSDGMPIEDQSNKITCLLDILHGIKKEKEKALIFTPFLEMQNILVSIIKKHFGVFAHCINGNASQTSRKIMLRDFKQTEGFNVMLLSPKSAGLGLTITEANHVIHYHRMWNPALENQATDRVYRIGQEKPVNVYYLIGKDDEIIPTVDERLDVLLTDKRKLMSDYLNPKTDWKIRENDFADIFGRDKINVDIDCVDGLKWDEFERLVALLYQKRGFQTRLTPVNDYGADVVCFGHTAEPNTLLQVKHHKHPRNNVPNKVIGEIVSSRPVYEKEYLMAFNNLQVVTNSYFTENAKAQAAANDVNLMDRTTLSNLLLKNPISYSEIFGSSFT